MEAGGGDVNPYAAPASPVDLAPARPADMGGFRSVTPLAQAITVVMALIALFVILETANSLVAISVMHRVAAGETYDRSELTTVDQRARIVRAADILLELAAAVLFCFFMPRANRNIRAMGAGPISFAPRWTAGCFFIPFWNLYGPYQAMKEIWQGSDPAWSLSSWQKPVPARFPAWWTLFLLARISQSVTNSLSKHIAGPSDFIDKSWVAVAILPFHLVAAILAAAVVREVAQRQDERQRRLHAAAAPAGNPPVVTAGAGP